MLLLRFESNRHFFFVFGQREFYYQERGSTPSEVKKNNSHHHHYNHLSVWLRSIMTSLCLLVILFFFFIFLLSRWLSPYSRVRLFALWEFQIVSDFFFFSIWIFFHVEFFLCHDYDANMCGYWWTCCQPPPFIDPTDFFFHCNVFLMHRFFFCHSLANCHRFVQLVCKKNLF